jgi:radical SAM superfamily enzyme YgiQ (UPF0313 family)
VYSEDIDLKNMVYVNAPIVDNNPNFVENPIVTLDYDSEDGLFLKYKNKEYYAAYVYQPNYPLEYTGQDAFPSVTHGDRVRISPVRGCAVACAFCSVPYEERYAFVPVESCMEALDIAIKDKLQPSRHIMISGGIPRKEDAHRLNHLYLTVLENYKNKVNVDIMMAPLKDGVNFIELIDQGVHELSINLEIYNREIENKLAKKKFEFGRENYLEQIEKAADRIAGRNSGGGVRSMLMVGLEPSSDTVSGAVSIAEHGGIPVLSPFRPSPFTPLKDFTPPSFDTMKEIYLRVAEKISKRNIRLGPTCLPCTHNTISFAENIHGEISYEYTPPNLYTGRKKA